MNSSSLRHSPQHIIFQANNLYLLAKKSLRFLCRGQSRTSRLIIICIHPRASQVKQFFTALGDPPVERDRIGVLFSEA